MKKRFRLASIPLVASVLFVPWLIAACGGGTATSAAASATPDSPPGDDVPRAGSLDLSALAGRVSKERLDPFWPEIQGIVGSNIHVEPVGGTTADERFRRATAGLSEFAQRFETTPNDFLPWSRGLGAFSAVEEIAFDKESAPELRAAAIVRLLNFYDAVLAAPGFIMDSRHADEEKRDGGMDAKGTAVLALVLRLWSRAGELRDAAAAEILRAGEPGDSVRNVLYDRAERAYQERKLEDALSWAEAEIRFLGDGADTSWWVWLSCFYYLGLDVPRGDAAMRRGGVDPTSPQSNLLGTAMVDHLGGAANLRAAAVELAAMPPFDKPAERDIRRAWLLLRLERPERAAALVGKLRGAFPNDARVATLEMSLGAISAFATAQLSESEKMPPALLQTIERASNYAHRDADFYETAIWLEWAGQAVTAERTWRSARFSSSGELKADAQTILSLMDLGEIRRLVEEYRAISPGRAAVLSEEADLLLVMAALDSKSVEQIVPVLREAAPRVLALVEEHPEQTDAWKLAAALAWLGEDREAWKALMRRDAPVSTEDESIVAGWQAKALLYLAAVAGDEPLLNEAERRMEEVSTSSLRARAALVCPRADAATLKAVLRGGESAWLRAVDAIDTCLEAELTDAERARFVSNWAYCSARANQVGAAISAWEGASAPTIDDAWKIAANLAAMHLARGTTADAVGDVRRAAGDWIPFDENLDSGDWARWLFWYFGSAGKPTDQALIAQRLAELSAEPAPLETPWRDRDAHIVPKVGGVNFSLEMLPVRARAELRAPFEIWLYPSAPVTDEEIDKFRRESPKLLEISASGAKKKPKL